MIADAGIFGLCLCRLGLDKFVEASQRPLGFVGTVVLAGLLHFLVMVCAFACECDCVCVCQTLDMIVVSCDIERARKRDDACEVLQNDSLGESLRGRQGMSQVVSEGGGLE